MATSPKAPVVKAGKLPKPTKLPAVKSSTTKPVYGKMFIPKVSKGLTSYLGSTGNLP